MKNDNHIIAQLKKGQTSALEEVMNQYSDYVYTILKSMLTKVEAEEASQDTFIKVYRNINSYREESKFSTWLYSIAYRTGLDYIKKRKRHQSINDINTVNTAMNQFHTKNDLQEWLEMQLKKIDPEDATLIRLFYFKELNVKEVAEITGISISNVKVKLYRIRKVLREQMAHLKLEDILN